MKVEMNLSYFSAFRAIMLTGTISGAAEILGRSQPSVSRLLDKLEFELDIALFERRKGLVTPTPEAHKLLAEVERTYASLEALRTFARQLARGSASQISGAVQPAFGIDFLPNVITRFQAKWPTTKISLNLQAASAVEELAASQQIDFGISEMPFRRSGFVVDPFINSSYVAAVHSSHPLSRRDTIGLNDLVDTSLILYPSPTTARLLFNEAAQQNGINIEPDFETNYSSAAYSMVKLGLGIALLDPFTAILQRTNEVKILQFSPAIPFKAAILRPDHRPSTPAIDALIELIKTVKNDVLAEIAK